MISIEEFTDNPISDIIKMFVNDYTWELRYGNSDMNDSIKYLLCTNSYYYFMGENGKIISVSNSRDGFICKDIVMFTE